MGRNLQKYVLVIQTFATVTQFDGARRYYPSLALVVTVLKMVLTVLALLLTLAALILTIFAVMVVTVFEMVLIVFEVQTLNWY